MTYVDFVKDDYSRVSDNVYITGWAIDEPIFSTSVVEYDFEQKFSHFTAVIPIERSIVNAVLKNLLPASIITGLSFIIFWIPENYTPRIYLTAPLLLSLVYIHTSNLGSLSALGYLTLYDKIMIVYYALFVNSILSLGIQMRLNTLGKPELVIKCNTVQKYLIPVSQ